MVSEIEHYCPSCETDRPFKKSASTKVHLGEKTKWYCEECDHQIVIIDGIDSTATA